MTTVIVLTAQSTKAATNVQVQFNEPIDDTLLSGIHGMIEHGTMCKSDLDEGSDDFYFVTLFPVCCTLACCYMFVVELFVPFFYFVL